MKLSSIERKKFRIRNKLKKVSSTDRLRLSITRSTKNISAQLIDDKKQSTILSASSNEKDMRSVKKNKIDISILVAEKLPGPLLTSIEKLLLKFTLCFCIKSNMLETN